MKRDTPKLADGPTFIPDEWRTMLEAAMRVDPTTAVYTTYVQTPLRWRVRAAWNRIYERWPFMLKKNCEECDE